MHLTGLYPDWWRGRWWGRPVKLWAAGVSWENTRDNVQRLTMGPPDQESEWGTAAIPKDSIVSWSRSRNIPNGLSSVTVKHALSGGMSSLVYKAYEQGREKWTGESLDALWYDEEPPEDIYIEGLTRLVARNGIAFMTFTPLLGMTEVVRKFPIVMETDNNTVLEA